MHDVDWAHVAEEIEDVGLWELHSVESFLNLILVHLLKLHVSPESQACAHWRGEVVAFQNNAKRRFAPSMRQRIDIATLYDEAVQQLRATDPSGRFPTGCPFDLDQLLDESWEKLLERLTLAAA